MKKLVLVACLFFAVSSMAYQYMGGQAYLSGGVGANINVIRLNNSYASTPKGSMPLYLSLDYAVDNNWALFGTIAPQFSGSAVSFLSRAGLKYWLNIFEAPLVPYFSLALTPAYMWKADEPSHFNIGLSPGLGINYFVLANFLVGLHLNLNPTYAFIKNEGKMELAVTSLLDLSFRI